METFSSSEKFLTQGFQQPYYVTTDITEDLISVFLNPSSDFINVSINGIGQTKAMGLFSVKTIAMPLDQPAIMNGNG